MVFTPADRKLYLYAVPISGVHGPSPAMARIRVPFLTRGDINDDGHVDLADVLLILRMMTGNSSDGLQMDYEASGADINGDKKAGLDEAIFILQSVAGMKSNTFD